MEIGLCGFTKLEKGGFQKGGFGGCSGSPKSRNEGTKILQISRKIPREASTLIFKIRSCIARTDLQNKAFSAHFCLLLRSALTVQDRIL